MLLREEVLKRSEQKLREEAKQLAAGGQQLTQKLQEQLHNLEETSRCGQPRASTPKTEGF